MSTVTISSDSGLWTDLYVMAFGLILLAVIAAVVYLNRHRIERRLDLAIERKHARSLR